MLGGLVDHQMRHRVVRCTRGSRLHHLHIKEGRARLNRKGFRQRDPSPISHLNLNLNLSISRKGSNTL